jgi:hypothetical protein
MRLKFRNTEATEQAATRLTVKRIAIHAFIRDPYSGFAG